MSDTSHRPAPATGKLPISVLTGFLGSGKTSFLSRVLASPGLADTAVIINEFGAAGLDHLLLEAGDGEVVTLANGCLCCTVRQGLAATLYRLLKRRATGELPPFRRIALETSGLAEPAPILYTLSADAFLEHALALHAVVTTVDTLAGLDTLDRFPEATAQAACADRLLLTKTDLAPASPELLARLEALNPTASLAQAEPAEILFGGVATIMPRRRLFASATHAHGIASLVIILRRAMSRLDFAIALGGLAQDHGADLLRVKGIVAFADCPDRPAVIHAVQHTLYPPRWLEAWPDDDTTSRLVLILRDISPDLVLRYFQAGDPTPMDPTTGGGD